MMPAVHPCLRDAARQPIARVPHLENRQRLEWHSQPGGGASSAFVKSTKGKVHRQQIHGNRAV